MTHGFDMGLEPDSVIANAVKQSMTSDCMECGIRPDAVGSQ